MSTPVVLISGGTGGLGAAMSTELSARGCRVYSAARSRPPLVPDGAATLAPPYEDPVPQALILTAIVIGFGLLAFSLVLAHRVHVTTGTDDVDSLGRGR